jgi:hypothetical protein
LFYQFDQGCDFGRGRFEKALFKFFGGKGFSEEGFNVEMKAPAFDSLLAGP